MLNSPYHQTSISKKLTGPGVWSSGTTYLGENKWNERKELTALRAICPCNGVTCEGGYEASRGGILSSSSIASQ